MGSRARVAILAVGLAGTASRGLAQPPTDSARVAAVAPPPAPAPTRAPDPWLGSDKAKHFLLAGMVQGTAFGVATAAGVEGRPALVAASIATAVVSVGKEVHDRRRGGRFSARDLAWDALGGTLWGVLVARSGR